MNDDEYKGWLRNNGVASTDANGDDQAKAIFPWWVWAIIVGAAYKGVKYLMATSVLTLL